MALTELMAFTNASILVLSFALLLIVLSFNVSNINSVAVFANAKSIASALTTRLITSPNCFAYKLPINYYSSSPIMAGGPIYTVYDTEPGVVDSAKFIGSKFLSCVQYTYSQGATNVPILTTGLTAMTGVSATLVDTQNPQDLGPSGSLSLNNYGQLSYGGAFYAREAALQKFATYAEYAALASSIAVSMALQVVTGTTVNANIILAVGSNSYNQINPQYTMLAALASEDTYTESMPVAIEFTNSQGAPVSQDTGILEVTVNYGVVPYA